MGKASDPHHPTSQSRAGGDRPQKPSTNRSQAGEKPGIQLGSAPPSLRPPSPIRRPTLSPPQRPSARVIDRAWGELTFLCEGHSTRTPYFADKPIPCRYCGYHGTTSHSFQDLGTAKHLPYRHSCHHGTTNNQSQEFGTAKQVQLPHSRHNGKPAISSRTFG